MSQIRVCTIVIVAILALAATGFAQSPGAQPSTPGQQAQPAVPGQQPQPAVPGQQPQPAAPGQPDSSQNRPAAGAASPADAVAKQLAQVLNLSDTQTTQVKNVLEDEQTKLIALRDDRTLSAQDKQTKLMDIRRNASDKVMSILTPEQQRRLADAIQKQQPQNQQPGAQKPQPPH